MTHPTNARDAQFTKFAELLAEELKTHGLLDLGNRMLPLVNVDLDYEEVKRIITQRAYDLAYHVIDSCNDQESAMMSDVNHIDVDSMLPNVPDMTEWPG